MPGVHLHLLYRGMSGGGSSGRRGGAAPPKGWVAIRVGGEGEEQQRFLVPVGYLNHPLFVALLRVAEEEYGFHHSGAITIPCHVEHFRHVQGIIDRDNSSTSSSASAAAAAGAGGHRHHHFHLCFRA
ncbi:hypothetical protein Cni_G21903 [Canna indica]|uniref:Uncharacterized protein n=1 Tax=Canna indica TaxID=4628 RepID=A0AAQ3KQV6_9LILI|nr:hypothetical protein Cni_G21903 [Canna indica]